MLPRARQAPAFSVTFFRWGVIILGIIHGWQAFLLWHQLPLLNQFSNTIAPQVRLVLAAIWGTIWLILWLLMSWKTSLPSRILTILLIIYTSYQLFMQFQSSGETVRAGWPITALTGGLAVFLSLWLGRSQSVKSGA